MIIVPVKEDSIDKALRKFKKKFEKTGILKQLRSRQGYEKKSVTRRNTVKRAIFRNKILQQGLQAGR
jgi:small subunit ribosomal protein S21